MCLHICVHLCACTCGDQRLMSYVFCNYSPPPLWTQGFYLNLELTDLATLNDQQGSEVLLSLPPSSGVTGIHCYARIYHRGTEAQTQVFMLYGKPFANETTALTPTLALFVSSANSFTHDAKRIFPEVTLLSLLCSQASNISLLSTTINSIFYHSWPCPVVPWTDPVSCAQ